MSVSPTAGPSSLSRVLAQAPTPTSPRPQSVLSSPYNAERSRSRTTSLSSVRPPHLNGSNKAAATTALSEPAVPAASSAAAPDNASTPSPSGSAFDGMGSVVTARRRPTSMAPGVSAGSTLANIASNWGLPIGRRRTQLPTRTSPVPSEIE
ncbi:hypothetical protein FRC08_006423 [Ceratobasidium sp. 394]|nr:hypothetical protein FRC08_006423 [Ceratobasidium sp. 394]